MKKLVQLDHPPPDELRCRQSDGKKWRCKNLISKSGNCNTLCEYHCEKRSISWRKRYALKKKSRREEGGGGDGGGGLEEKLESDDKEKKERRTKTKMKTSNSSTTCSLLDAARVSIDSKQRDDGTIGQSVHDSSDRSPVGKADLQSEVRNAETRKQCLKAERKSRCKGSNSGETRPREVELEKDLEVYKTKCCELSLELEKKEMEFRDLESKKIDVEDVLKKYKTICDGIKGWIGCLEVDQLVVFEREKRALERITYFKEELEKMETVKCIRLKTDKKDSECMGRRAEDENEVWKKRLCELETRLLRMEEENRNVRCMESRGSKTLKLEPGGLQSEVSHDDERKKVENKTSKHQRETNGETNSAHVALLPIKEEVLNASTRIFTSAVSGSSSVNMEGKSSINVKEKEKNTPVESRVELDKVSEQLELGLKRSSSKRQSSERSWDNDKDVTPNKRSKGLSLNQRDEEYGLSCMDDFPSTSTHKQKWVPELVTSESKSEAAVKRKKCHEQKNKVPKLSPVNLCSEMVDNPTAENVKENVAKKVGLDRSSSGDSFSNSEEEEDAHLAFDKALAMILRRRGKELKWKFEADMLSSFEEDLELCMKAVCALYRQQTCEENSINGFLHYSNRGFNKFDALRGTTLAEFLMDGEQKGDLKKSVKELEVFDPKALEDCKRLAMYYSDQLFLVYQNKEDPFFLPASADH